jgi:hypothetical protein
MKNLLIFSLVIPILTLIVSCGSPTISLDISTSFIPCGFMGDGESPQNISIDPNWSENPHSAPKCIKITYNISTIGWAGIYWLSKDNPCNWGEVKGFDLSKKGFTKITFWAKGLNGSESVQFKSGGVKDKTYKDSFDTEPKLGVNLSKDWQKFTIDLKGQDLSSVIGGFCWVANSNVTLFLDDIRFE